MPSPAMRAHGPRTENVVQAGCRQWHRTRKDVAGAPLLEATAASASDFLMLLGRLGYIP